VRESNGTNTEGMIKYPYLAPRHSIQQFQI